MRTLLFSSLFPNSVQPRHGIFVRTRLLQLLKHSGIATDVIAPVPWFPFSHNCFGQYGLYARVPRQERDGDLEVLHPRFPVIPKVGMTISPVLMAKACLPLIRRLMASGKKYDVIDAHYFYPDGVAAVMIGRELNIPVVITARGTDVNVFPNYAGPRRHILRSAKQCGHIITVCEALKHQLVKLGVDGEKITVLRNGVDTELFYPEDYQQSRASLGFEKKTLLCVGNLIPLKGFDLVIQALAELPEFDLIIIGEGGEEQRHRQLAAELGVASRVRFVGIVDQVTLRKYYSAADVLVSASSREGLANVLIEAMACGLPVVATPVGGSPEVVTERPAGQLLPERNPAAIARSVQGIISQQLDRDLTATFASKFSWEKTSIGQLSVFSSLADQRSNEGEETCAI